MMGSSDPAVSRTDVRPAVPADRVAVERLLADLSLPLDGVADWIDRFWVADSAGAIVAVAGLELYDGAALLRSVAVVPARRGTGIARTLVERVLESARAGHASDAYLLTTTAERYFPRLGFETITRDEVPESVRRSVEFREACPASAVVMRKRLVTGAP